MQRTLSSGHRICSSDFTVSHRANITVASKEDFILLAYKERLKLAPSEPLTLEKQSLNLILFIRAVALVQCGDYKKVKGHSAYTDTQFSDGETFTYKGLGWETDIKQLKNKNAMQ